MIDFTVFSDELKIFLYSHTGVISALRCRKEYFEKHRKCHLWDELERRYPSTYTLRQRIIAAVELKLQTIDLCVVCQQHPRMIAEHTHYSRYCSSLCARRDTVKFQHVKQKRNESVAGSKRRATMRQKYGVEYNSQRSDIKKILAQPKVNAYALAKLTDMVWLKEQYVTNQRTSVDIAQELDCYYGTVIEYLKKHQIEIIRYRQTSQIETDIHDFLTLHGIKSEQHNRSIVSPYELDLVIPEHKIAIEVNGLYWHSYDHPEQKSEREKHQKKTNLCLKNGYTLVHITDWEWTNKRTIVESMLLQRCGIVQEKYDARKCAVQKITPSLAKSFLTTNHIQGFVGASLHYALWYGDRLVSVFSVGKPRFSQHAEYELLRFATLLHSSVRGGFSKLMKAFIQEHQPHTMISYADRRFGEGNVYRSMGFVMTQQTSPGYCWTDGTQIWSRYQTQKHKLSEMKLQHYDSTWSESQILFANKYRRLWDCGQNVWMWSVN